MKVAFRVDASFEVGVGHLMRCLTLADAFKKRHYKVLFICRFLPESLSNRVKAKGFSLVEIDVENTEGNQPSSLFSHESDAARTIDIISSLAIDLMVVDHYQIDAEWERKIGPYVARLMVIDDLANRVHECHVLLDQNYYRNYQVRYKGLVPDTCQLLLGPNYILLRSEFSQIRKANPRGDRALKSVKRIQICFGGSDPTMETIKTLKAVAKLSQFYSFEVIVGAANNNIESIRRFGENLDRIEIAVDANDMAERMANADIAIGAAGSMCWERASQGLPSIVIALADNQLEAANDLNDIGFHKYLGYSTDVSENMILHALEELIAKPELRQQFAKVSQEMVDAVGCERIVHMLFPIEVD